MRRHGTRTLRKVLILADEIQLACICRRESKYDDSTLLKDIETERSLSFTMLHRKLGDPRTYAAASIFVGKLRTKLPIRISSATGSYAQCDGTGDSSGDGFITFDFRTQHLSPTNPSPPILSLNANVRLVSTHADSSHTARQRTQVRRGNRTLLIPLLARFPSGSTFACTRRGGLDWHGTGRALHVAAYVRGKQWRE